MSLEEKDSELCLELIDATSRSDPRIFSAELWSQLQSLQLINVRETAKSSV
jgi:hypothetical protein